MKARTVISRGALPCALILTALSLFAGPKAKEAAPRFNAIATSGEKFTNDSIKGKVVLLEFWTTWCGFCADEASFVMAHKRIRLRPSVYQACGGASIWITPRS